MPSIHLLGRSWSHAGQRHVRHAGHRQAGRLDVQDAVLRQPRLAHGRHHRGGLGRARGRTGQLCLPRICSLTAAGVPAAARRHVRAPAVCHGRCAGCIILPSRCRCRLREHIPIWARGCDVPRWDEQGRRAGLGHTACVCGAMLRRAMRAVVALAIERDGSSGGCIRLGVITQAGIERHVRPCSPLLHPHSAQVILNNDIPRFTLS